MPPPPEGDAQRAARDDHRRTPRRLARRSQGGPGVGKAGRTGARRALECARRNPRTRRRHEASRTGILPDRSSPAGPSPGASGSRSAARRRSCPPSPSIWSLPVAPEDLEREQVLPLGPARVQPGHLRRWPCVNSRKALSSTGMSPEERRRRPGHVGEVAAGTSGPDRSGARPDRGARRRRRLPDWRATPGRSRGARRGRSVRGRTSARRCAPSSKSSVACSKRRVVAMVEADLAPRRPVRSRRREDGLQLLRAPRRRASPPGRACPRATAASVTGASASLVVATTTRSTSRRRDDASRRCSTDAARAPAASGARQPRLYVRDRRRAGAHRAPGPLCARSARSPTIPTLTGSPVQSAVFGHDPPQRVDVAARQISSRCAGSAAQCVPHRADQPAGDAVALRGGEETPRAAPLARAASALRPCCFTARS